MHHDDAIDAAIDQRQLVLAGENRLIASLRRPADDALAGRHDHASPLGTIEQGAEERDGITEPEHARARQIRPQAADLPPDQPPHQLSLPGGVKGLQVENVRAHLC